MEVKRVDTYVYKLVRNGQTVYIGITNDLKRREQEHREDKQFDKMQVIKVIAKYPRVFFLTVS